MDKISSRLADEYRLGSLLLPTSFTFNFLQLMKIGQQLLLRKARQKLWLGTRIQLTDMIDNGSLVHR